MSTPYDNIINLPHYQSATRPRMPAIDRAAQFAPFAALTGHDEAIKETARLTDVKAELDEYCMSALNERLTMIQDAINERPAVNITYFIPDKKKAGGSYITAFGIVKKIDEYEHTVIMRSGTKIPIDDILDISGELFSSLEYDNPN